jgi:hypothetical protein
VSDEHDEHCLDVAWKELVVVHEDVDALSSDDEVLLLCLIQFNTTNDHPIIAKNSITTIETISAM